ncbi:MAG: hypothetical protein ACK4R7_01195 [Fervidobacterium sp.]
MMNINSIDFAYVENFVNYTVSFWYILLPLALFFYFLPNIVESFSLFAFGAILGITYVSPMILNLVNMINLEWVNLLTQNIVIFNVILSFLCGLILYSIYKAVIFIGSFLISLIGMLFFIRTFFGEGIIWYIPITLGLIAGIVAGSFATKNSSKFIGLFAVLLGSFELSSIGISLLNMYIFKLSNFILLWLVLILFLILFFVRIRTLWGSKK